MAYDYVSPTLGIAANGIKHYAPKVGFTATETAMMKKAVGRVGNFAGAVSLLNSIHQMNQAQTSEKKAEYFLDASVNALGFVPYIGPALSLYWNMGGKQLHRSFTEHVIIPKVKEGGFGMQDFPFK